MLGYSRVGEKYPIEMPRVLGDAGYHTLGIGKMHWHPQRNAHGFNRLILDESGRAESPEFRSDYRGWFMSEAPAKDPDATGLTFNDYRAKAFVHPERLHPTHWTGETAMHFIETYDEPAPFFAKVSFARPHSPYDPPERWMNAYKDAAIPAAHTGDWADRYRPRSDDSPNIWHGDMGPEQVRHSRQGYYGAVSFIDEQIGRIFETLDRRGLLDNTLILYTSDHGDMTGDHHLWRKSYAYEASARVPMLMRWPKGMGPDARGVVMDQPVEIRDILPTFMHAAGAPGRDTLDGRSLLELVQGDAPDWRAWIDLEHDICYDPSNHWSALTDGKKKYIFHARDGEQQYFDLESDPGETTDLAGDPRHTREIGQWRQRLVEYLRERGDTFVKNGDLALRPESTLFSPNYPGCACHPQTPK
jgi:arylsulfatase